MLPFLERHWLAFEEIRPALISMDINQLIWRILMSNVKNIAFFSMLALSAISAQTVVAAEVSAMASPSSASTPSEGEVRKIDKDAGKLTIKHGALENLGMPAMTMVFKAKDTAMLDSLKVGDKISFIAEKVDGQITVTKIDVKN